MNRKGFTLMELLLVVAVLAIVAAAAAPTFFGGAQEAMNEAKKASFMSAYQNTISGANIYLSIEASKGNTVNDTALQTALNTYAPVAGRAYALNENLKGNLTAIIVDNAVKVVKEGQTTPLFPNGIPANITYDDLVNNVK